MDHDPAATEPATRPAEDDPSHVAVPRPVRVAADWSWRLLVIGAAVLALLLLAARLKLLLLALFVALLVAALLAPAVRWVQARLGGRRGLATAVVLVVAIGVVVGVVALLAWEVSGSFNQLGDEFADGLAQIRTWLRDTFHIDDAELQGYLQQAWDAIRANRDGLLSGALSGAAIALEVLSGAAIALFSTIFFLLDGERIWAWVTNLFPRRTQPNVREVGRQSWAVLTAYVRGTVIIATVDAVCIGLAVAVLRVPLAIPLAALVFVGAFVPIVGAFVSGFVAVVVALATQGPWTALLVLAAIIAVQQIEGHLLQPLLLGRLVRIHPLGIVLAVTAGSVLAGLVGAVVAVPLTAVVTTVLAYYGRLARAETIAGDPIAPGVGVDAVDEVDQVD
jgi:predicted PurR-regulated permease PerM